MSKRYPSGLITTTNIDNLVDANLGASASGVWTLDDVAYFTQKRTWPTYDPYIGQNALMLHGNGTNGANNNTFLDSSTNNFTVTRNGNVAQGSFSPYNPRSYSTYFASTDYVTATQNANFAFGTGNFTIEFYGCRQTAAVSQLALTNRSSVGATFNGDWWIDNTTASNLINVSFSTSLGARYTTTCTTDFPPAGVWFHLAVVRTSTAITIYLNGQQIGASTVSSGDSFGLATANVYAGRFSNSTTWLWPGWLSNVRITKGVAVYTSNFTPSFLPLTSDANTALLMLKSSRFIDSSSNNVTVTPTGTPSPGTYTPFSPASLYNPTTMGGSGYFDGTGDYLTVPSNAAFQFGATDFSVEAWVYITATPAAGAVIMGVWTATAATSSWALTQGSTSVTAIRFAYSNGTTITSVESAAGFIALNKWIHISASRVSNTLYIYVNGALATSAAITATLASPATVLSVFGSSTGTLPSTGYISDARVIKGTVSVPVPVPTAPLTAVPNTTLLLNCINAGVYDSLMETVGETAATFAISTTQSKFGSGSMVVTNSSGTANYLSIPHQPQLDLITGDFTIEFWMYPTSFSGTYILNKDGILSTNFAQYAISLNINGRIGFDIGAANGAVTSQSFNSGTTFMTVNTWNHVACVRQGTLVMIFVNGVLGGSGTQTITMVSGSRPLYINFQQGSASTVGVNGYLNEIRITRGVARYTGNFTVPRARFQDA